MQSDTAVVAAKAVATGGAAAIPFGLTWWAVGAALFGVVAGLYFDKETAADTLVRRIFGIFAFAFVAALVAGASSHAPPIFGWEVASVPIEIRAGLCGVFSQGIVSFCQRLLGRVTPGG